jgi:hypothetical protein
MAVKLALSTKGIVPIVVAVTIVEALILNPIRFHQTAQADGHTMSVPVFWEPVKNPGSAVAVAYQHEWSRLVGQASVAITDRGADSAAPWTADEARKQLAFLGVLQSRNKDYTDPRFFDLSGNKFSSVCQETTVKGNEAMLCFVVGTPLQFSYLGSKTYEPAARKMLASLN